jgi:uncharacterized membrane protein YjgN (DUF898 family)
VGTFRPWLSAGEVLSLEAVNVLAIVGTLGLATPWAAMRRARYRWSRIELRLDGSIDSVTALAAPAPGVLGDVAADQLAIDIAL